MTVLARSRLLVVVTAAVLLAAGLVIGVSGLAFLGDDAVVATASTCARGFEPVERALSEVRHEMAGEGDSEEAEREAEEAEEAEDGENGEDTEEAREAAEEAGYSEELVREAQAELPMLRGTDPREWDSLCVVGTRPESLKELIALFGARAIPRLAPYGTYAPGAARNAVAQRASMTPGSVAGTEGTGRLWGRGPLIVDDPRYPEVNGLGLHKNNGRIDSYSWDDQDDVLYAAVGNGGIWRSSDLGATWQNASGNLPTSVTGAVAWSRYDGGTLVALTGEPTFGSSAYTGLGAYWSQDGGRHWTRAKGVPEGGLGFAVAVDPRSPNRVFAATQLGLFRSVDGGKTFDNVDLPTGRCSGVTDISARPECALANVVTDVVVSRGGGENTQTDSGTVVATVGWRGGSRTNPDGSVQSPRNGVYRSATGRPGSFTKLATTGFAAQDHIGRVELGQAVGRGQDHDFLYALVQDAKLLNNGGVVGIDAPEGSPPPVGSTVLNGLYVSDDFGQTWTKMASGTELASDPASGSALFGTGTAIGYQPGVQGWYNLWVQPDPSRSTADGVPTRLAFGLEEIWANEPGNAGQPLDGTTPVHFRVVGKYFGGDSCLLLSAGLPTCPGDREPTDDNTTTHPDQQDGIWIRDKSVGGTQLVVGNDGGAYRYRFEDDDDKELDNSHWGPGDNEGFSTLMPYYAAMAKDGTVFAGLQDNGNLRISPRHKQFEVYGGDGFFAAIDPDDSDTGYEEYTNGAISGTTDGGTSWKDMDPGLSASKFSTPFIMDPLDADHIATGGREIVETLVGPATDSGMTDASEADDSTTTWRKVFDLGTRQHPGDPTAEATATDPANSMSAVDVRGDAVYAGFCGQCDTLNKLAPDEHVFKRGLATNVGGARSPKAGTKRGWHIVAAKGLPNRYITSIAIDPRDPEHVFVTLGGYTRRWLPPGAVGDANAQLGTGHLFTSHDGGQTFTNVSGNLPDSPATWVETRAGQLLVGTDVGAFASGMKGASSTSPSFAPLEDVPQAPISSITLKPGQPNTAVLAVFGRGVWTYDFDQRVKVPVEPAPTPLPTVGTAYQSYDFEDGQQGWTASGLPPWSLGTPGHGEGTAEAPEGKAWSLAGPTSYVDNADTSIVSPPVDVPAGDTVAEWWMKLDTEGGYDTVDVEWSSDGGTTWKPLGSYSGRNADYPGWSRYAVPFTAPGGQVQLRYHFVSDSLCSGAGGPLCSSPNGWDGVHVDDVTVGSPG